MTVSTTAARNVKTGNGATTSFPFDFAFEADGDLVVTLVVIDTGAEAPQTLTTDYTTTGGSGAIGTIEMIVAPATGEELVIERDLAYTQGTDYQPNDPFPAEVNETALDRLTFLVQQVLDFTQRSLKLKKTTILTDVTFPDPEVDKVLVGKNATEFQNKKISDIDPSVTPLPLSVANGGTNAITAVAARTSLGLGTTDTVEFNLLGVGNARTDGTAHIHTASAGAVVPASDSDDLVVENSTSGGISILVPDTAGSILRFGSPADPSGSRLDWVNSTGLMRLGTETAGGQLSLTTDASVEAMRLNADGLITQPLQCAFLAFNSVTDDDVTGNGLFATVEFNIEVYDQNGDYSDTTDTFTAPVTGRYLFSLSVHALNLVSAATVQIGLVTSNRTYFTTWTSPPDSDFSTPVSVVADMEASDTATVELFVNGMAGDTVDIQGSVANSITFFSGCLLA